MKISKDTGKFRNLFLLVVSVFFLCAAVSLFPQQRSDPADLVELREGWEFRWGDSPKNSAGVPLWVNEEMRTPGWKSMTLPGWAPDREKHNYLWQRVILPEGTWKDPVLFLLGPFLYFEVYLDDALIYSHGDPDKPEQAQLIGAPWHIIPLEGNFQEKTLSFRVFSNYYLIGIPEKVLLGSRAAIYRQIITRDIDRLIIGVLSLFLGCFSMILFFRYRSMKIYLHFALFTLMVGVYIIRYTWVKQFFIDTPMVWIYLWILSIFSIPIGILGFVRSIFGDGYKNIISYLFWIHIILSPIFITIMFLFPMESAKFILITIRILYLFYIGVMLFFIAGKAARKDRDAQVFLSGFFLLIIFGTFDILVGLGLIPWIRPLAHIGMFLFTLALVVLLERHFVNIYRNLKLLTAERERLGGELHDGISGIMTNINLLTEIVRKQPAGHNNDGALDTIAKLSREGLSEVQSFMHSLDEEEKSWSALAADFRLHGTTTLSPFGIKFIMKTEIGNQTPPPSSLLLLNLYRIYKEAITNIVKHSGAQKVEVELICSRDNLVLTIRDDGKGISNTTTRGRGLAGMKTRAGEIGGTIETTSDNGTLITLTLNSPKNTHTR